MLTKTKSFKLVCILFNQIKLETWDILLKLWGRPISRSVQQNDPEAAKPFLIIL